MKQRTILAFILCLTAFTFQRAFFAEYVLWDDDALIFNNIMLKMPFWEALKTASTSYYHGDYFPLTLTSYWIDNALFGMNAFPQHVINWLMHLISVSLLFLFLNKFTQNKTIVYLATLAYAVHPLQTETVMWISERKSLLSSMLTFGSLWLYLKSYEEKPKRYFVAAWFCFVLACLAKATTVLLPVLFLAMDFWHYKKQWKTIAMRLAPMAAAAIVLSQFRVAAYAASVGFVTDTMWHTERLVHVPGMALNAIGFYMEKFFWPQGLAAMYANYLLDTKTWIVCILVVVFLVYVFWKIWKTRERDLIFFSLWFLLFLAPVLQIVPRINYVNDRYMYLPIVGFVGMLLSLDFGKLIKKIPSRLHVKLFVSIAITWSLLAMHQSEVWETNRSLWQNVIRVFPESAIAHNNLGLDYQKMEEFDKAVYHFTLILERAAEEQNRLLAYNNLANIYANPRFSGFNPEISIKLLREGISRVQRVRDSYELRINLAVNYLKANKMDLGKAELSNLLRDLNVEPDYRYNWLREMAQNISNQLRLAPVTSVPSNSVK